MVVPVLDPELILMSDASTLDWGVVMGLLRTLGVWSRQEAQAHINWLELQAVYLSIMHCTSVVSGCHVEICSDNTML